MSYSHLALSVPMQLEYEELLAEQSATALLAVLRRLDKERVASSLRLPPGSLCSFTRGRPERTCIDMQSATMPKMSSRLGMLGSTANRSPLACS